MDWINFVTLGAPVLVLLLIGLSSYGAIKGNRVLEHIPMLSVIGLLFLYMMWLHHLKCIGVIGG